MSEKELPHLIEKYRSLSAFEQNILKVLSVIYEPISTNFFFETLRHLKIADSNAVVFMTDVRFRAYKSALVAAGLLTITDRNEFACSEAIIEMVFREAVKAPFFADLVTWIDQRIRFEPSWYYYNVKFERTIRELRLAYYLSDSERLNNVHKMVNERFMRDMQNFRFNDRFFGNPIDLEWLEQFNPEIQCRVLCDQIETDMMQGEDATKYIAIARQKAQQPELNSSAKLNYSTFLFKWHLFRGELAAARQCIAPKQYMSLDIRLLATADMLEGKWGDSLEKFALSLKAYRKEVHTRKTFFEDYTAIFYILLLFRQKNDAHFIEAETLLSYTSSNPSVLELRSIIAMARNNKAMAESLLQQPPDGPFSWIIHAYCYYWAFGEKAGNFLSHLKSQYQIVGENGYRYLEMELAHLLSIYNPKGDLYAARRDVLAKQLGIISISECVERQEPWMHALKALSLMGNTGKTNTEKLSRVVWLIDFASQSIQPKEQTTLKSGKWSEGRNIALKRLKSAEVDGLTEKDLQIIRALRQDYYHNELEWDYEQAILAMIGHPYIFLARSPQVAIELVKTEPELVIEETQKGYQIKLVPPVMAVGINIIKETTTRYLVLNVNEQHLSIQQTISQNGLVIPEKGKEQLLNAAKNLTRSITIHSPLLHDDAEIETIAADERLYFQLLPFGEGLRAEVYVKPFGDRPPYSKPGEGSATLMSNIDGKRIQTTRTLKREKNALADFIALCPTLDKNDTKTCEWQLDEPEEALQMLLEIEPLKSTNKIVVEWPKGEAFRIKYEANFDHLFMRAKKQNNWFNLEGELRLDETMVLDMRQLIEMVENSPNRFVRLNDGSFMALTKEFRRRLKEVSAFVETDSKGMRIHQLAAFAIDDFAKKISEFEGDAQWKKQIKRIKDLPKHNPNVPSTLQADLRNYQVDGYKWLSQLAHLGVGACLADDMGLGKTLQAIALILERAPKGPTLVVAPSSVCQNWINECNRFAPTLNPLLFGRGDRQLMVDELRPFDILVSSYTMMQQEAEMLGKVQWITTVLDEAQAIKNYQTKRSKAAMDLNSEFRLITTGTPIENHLGELWNLFNFINPGLLGSANSFAERFSTPIERYDDKDRRRHLQRLIQPFVLRRRKNQVLEELPQKTEIALTVELSNEEQAFYEALRLSAMEKLEGLKDTANEGVQRIQILAEITRLRQAACNAKLVMAEADLPSSKLNLFSEIVDELLENGHKALVFSQFVGHLKIIEQKVQQKGISYQYLDGSTPMMQRQKLVDAFQRGEGELFLISLKAGGVGLNLTAADYVIIMDPWWNPAVEDQAADRAHRIGQQRPVTIYRLVAQNTIEEKIVKLHHQKRDLADSLLEGTETAAKLSAGDLMKLISEI